MVADTKTDELKSAVLWATAQDRGYIRTSVPGLSAMRFNEPSGILHELYTPVLCLVLQGAKQVALGNDVREFAGGEGLIVSVEVPVVSRITRASREAPYLALAVDLDMVLLDGIAGQMAAADCRTLGSGPLLAMDKIDVNLIDCASRLIGLARRPEAEPILRPGVVRELYYLLLSGPLGAALRAMSRPDSHSRRIARAIALLRSGFAQPLPIDTLTAAAGMSPSSFHQHFKAVTSYSPLQFQKQLRLLEARRLMVSEGTTAKRAAFAVGYESTPQFTRDYAKRFGMPPRREVRANCVSSISRGAAVNREPNRRS